ncbi:DeoR/GlpR family DNA-binding transcription regulator [Elioraea rosea]|uniref:DeoR/GlpR family DNA-binding transcription regulator n=1 Tax=Elioraea rosea TaxID=2492390 RepID=UPI0013154E0F|nr:DeoR/GlpR family DNA-binding transcription regulator [Elioraea rosea]
MQLEDTSQLIPAARHALILDHVRARGIAAIAELAEVIGVSLSTVRRDLGDLAAQGLLRRTHGGAVALTIAQTTFEPAPAIAQHQHADAKRAIGHAGAALLDDGQSVVFDSSSTVLEAARATVSRGVAITAITNDLRIAAVLAEQPRVRLIVPGGSLRTGSYTLMGEPGVSFARGLAADIAFLGAHAVSGTEVSETSIEIATIKQAMAGGARRVAVLADSTKFGTVAFCRVLTLGPGHLVISDPDLGADSRGALEEAGVSVVTGAGEAGR